VDMEVSQCVSIYNERPQGQMKKCFDHKGAGAIGTCQKKQIHATWK